MQKLLLSLILLVAASVASAADSPKDVQALIAKGDYSGAEAALRQAVADHPQSAKAHYVLAEVLAHEGNIGEAKAEANKAAVLDPGTHFTDPAKFQSFQQKLDQALAPPSASRNTSSPERYAETRPAGARESGGGIGIGGIVLIVVVIGGIAFLWSRRRRAVDAPFGGYGAVPPPPPGSPYGGAPGGYPGYAPPPSSGMGSTIAAGVGGLAAGVLLDEALRSHNQNESNNNVGGWGSGGNNGGDVQRDPSGDAYNDLRDDPIDMGNNDSSWDDSSSSSDGGSFDDNQW
jgi:tetratricopeptide (TPR) repeat protein